MKRMTNKVLNGFFWFFVIFVLVISIIGYALLEWFDITYAMEFEALLFTLTSPLEGSDMSVVSAALEYMTPAFIDVIIYLFIFAIVWFLFKRLKISIAITIGKHSLRLNVYRIFQISSLMLAIITCFNAIEYCESTLRIEEYLDRKKQKTQIYEEYYVEPNEVAIMSEGPKKNVICIYLESMENTYASADVGGVQAVNYIPHITAYANENLSFSDTDKLGGALETTGATWTMGALFSSTAGIPFSFPIGMNNMNKVGQFAPGVTALGDVLLKKGYKQVFMCGSDGMFAGRQRYYEQHGEYQVMDYYYARENGYIPEDRFVWWGYEDKYLFDIAKTELLKLSMGEEPFNFTMLTVDTHPHGGYMCNLCDNQYENPMNNILICQDKQVSDFIEWCKQQDFYEDTVIVVLGDHLRMDRDVVGDAENRRIYNCFINTDTEVQGDYQYRQFTQLDMFPTILAAMGFEIEGDRLGLGTNLFSTTPTLAEEIGIDTLNNELGKYSQFYVDNFQ